MNDSRSASPFDRVVITNPGGLPEGTTVDELRQEGHCCREIRCPPRSFIPGIAQEKWGTGTSRMLTLCQNHGIFLSRHFLTHPDWFSVTFANNFSTDEGLLAMGFSDRQVSGSALL